jgi:hypothetical protein
MKYKEIEINKLISVFLTIFIVLLFSHFTVSLLFYTVIMGLILMFDWKSKKCSAMADEEYAKMTDQLDAPDQTVGAQADIISNSNGEIDNYLNLEKKSIFWKIGIDALWFMYWIALTSVMVQNAVKVEHWFGWAIATLFGVITITYLFTAINIGSKELNLFEQRKHKLLALANFMTTMKNHPLFDPNLPVIDSETDEPNREMFPNFPESQTKTMQARHEFSLMYAFEKAWEGELTAEQIVEIRDQEGWKNPIIE